MNPMIRKELRQRMRERRGWLLPSLYLVALGTVVLFAYFVTVQASQQNGVAVQGSSVGVAIYLTTAYAQLTLLLLLAPVFSAGAITIEKEQKTLSALLTSLLSGPDIWFGKIVSSLLFVVLLVVTAVPVLSLAFAFGGIGLYEVGMSLLTTLIILAAVSAIGLYWSSALRRSIHATAVSYAFIVVITVVTFIAFLVCTELDRNGRAWQHMPLWQKASLYLNPYFFLTTSFLPFKQLYPEWVRCAAVYLIMAAVASWAAVRNLRTGGEV
jgi:ABC-2 type transport system permease protein